MDVILSNTSGIPIYAQIQDQIKAAILRGDVAEGEALPSIRALARDLRVSVITTTRAYADLTAEGFLANVPGKGYYVLPRNSELVREQVLRQIEDLIGDAVARYRPASATDVYGDDSRTRNAIENLRAVGILERTDEEDRLIISPVIETLLPLGRLKDLLEWLQRENDPEPEPEPEPSLIDLTPEQEAHLAAEQARARDEEDDDE